MFRLAGQHEVRVLGQANVVGLVTSSIRSASLCRSFISSIFHEHNNNKLIKCHFMVMKNDSKPLSNIDRRDMRHETQWYHFKMQIIFLFMN